MQFRSNYVSADNANVPFLLQNFAVPMALRMGVQLGIFTAIQDHKTEGTTTQQIAESAGASPIVVGMLSPQISYIIASPSPTQAKY